MTEFALSLALVLLVAGAVGLLGTLLRASFTERLVALQLASTTTIGVLLLLSVALTRPALVDIALLFALLATTVALVFTRSPARHSTEEAAVTPVETEGRQ
ncbi:MAG: MrpF/PhaF family protein [Candidatus Competibacterales bacterium]